MTLYLDSSALVKRYVAELGSNEVTEAMDEAEAWSSCQVGFVETFRAVGLRAGLPGTRRVEREWPNVDVIALDRELVRRAATLAVATRLRALDAMHLAAALSLPRASTVFATWDRRLHRAARAHGLRTLPARLD